MGLIVDGLKDQARLKLCWWMRKGFGVYLRMLPGEQLQVFRELWGTDAV